MKVKKDIQQRIVEKNPLDDKADEEDLFSVLRSIAPGTNIRAALDGINKAGLGAIIAIETGWLTDMVDGGFRVNSRVTFQKLIELAKMDGAIVLSPDMKRILLANTLLTPNNRTPSNETGTRHKAAERVARQAATLVITVSERRNEITAYYKNIRYPLVNSEELLRKANDHIQMLEKQRDLFDKSLDKLDQYELRNYPSIGEAVQVIRKGKLVTKIGSDLKKYIIELGREGTLIKTRLREITSDVNKTCDLVLKDYTMIDLKKSKAMLEELSYEELLDKEKILNTLSFDGSLSRDPVRGWRILSKTSLGEKDIALLIKQAESLGKAIHSSAEFHKAVLGEEKSASFREEIESIKMSF